MQMRWVIGLMALAWGNLAAQSIVTPLGSGEETRLRAPVVSDADTVYQKHETLINVQFSQVQLSQWAAGGQSSASLIAKLCLLYTSPSPRDKRQSRMPSSA